MAGTTATTINMELYNNMCVELYLFINQNIEMLLVLGILASIGYILTEQHKKIKSLQTTCNKLKNNVAELEDDKFDCIDADLQRITDIIELKEKVALLGQKDHLLGDILTQIKKQNKTKKCRK